MPARTHPRTGARDDHNQPDEQADLGKLAAEMTPRGYQAVLRTAYPYLPRGRPPHLP